eukprot:1160135-Pelagomonas_calceolata.AAC.16
MAFVIDRVHRQMKTLFTLGFGLRPGGLTAQPAGLCQPNKNIHDIRKREVRLTQLEVLLKEMTDILIANHKT